MERRVQISISTEDGKTLSYEAFVPVDDGDLEDQRKLRRVVGTGVEMAFALMDAKFSSHEDE
jgi:hypothetical protein